MATRSTPQAELIWIKQCSKSSRILADERRGLLSRDRLTQCGCRKPCANGNLCGEGIYPRSSAQHSPNWRRHEDLGGHCAAQRGGATFR
jgi:hypothetical protein